MDRRDYLYAPSHVAPAFRPLFEYLQAALGARYEVWVRVEDFGRTLGAGVVNPSSKIAVYIRLQRGRQTIRKVLTPADIAAIRRHLTSNATQDLVL
jgi:hypothetical protein